MATPPLRIQVTADTRQAEAALDRTSAKVASVGARAKTAASGFGSLMSNMGGQGRFIINNTANQLGDMAVQLSMGTDAMRVMGFQLPQLLGGFAVLGGSLGVVLPLLGAVAAIGFPIVAALRAVKSETDETSFAWTRFANDIGINTQKIGEALDWVKGVFVDFGSFLVDRLNSIINAIRAIGVVVGALPEAFSVAMRRSTMVVRAFELDVKSSAISIQAAWQSMMDKITGSSAPGTGMLDSNLQPFETYAEELSDVAANIKSQANGLRTVLANTPGAGSVFGDALRNMKPIDLRSYFDAVPGSAKEAEGAISSVADQMERLQSNADSVADAISQGFREGVTLADKLKNAIGNVLERMLDLFLQQQIVGSWNVASQSGTGLMAAFGPLLEGLFSFDGGGFTGAGSRSGGVDGRGGFPAILHPNETVIDHTRGSGGAGGIVINQNISVNQGGQNIPPAKLFREIRVAATDAVADAMQRGGGFRGVMSS